MYASVASIYRCHEALDVLTAWNIQAIAFPQALERHMTPNMPLPDI